MFMRIACALAAAVVFLLTGSYTVTYSPIEEKELLLNFTAVSDIHIESNEFTRWERFADGLVDINGSKAPLDALVMTGDITMNGQAVEYFDAAWLLKLFNRAEVIPVMGNHGFHDTPEDTEGCVKRFLSFAGRVSRAEADGVYYSESINGYSFIVLGSEAFGGDSAIISDKQIEWLDSTLARATADGLPAFVFSHYAVKGTVRNYWPSGNLGERSDEVRAVLEKYKNVFYFSGHYHNAADFSGVSSISGVTYTDLPTFTGDGIGYQVEVYDDCVMLRARNYIEQRWIDELAVRVDIEQGNQFD